jgi:conjugative relaxase-like TrwC/TraI family protein
MVHASKPLTAGKIQSYFRDEYSSASNSYFTQSGTLKGHWHGQLATTLDLSGEVTPEAFDRLSEGQHPATGEQLIQHRDTIKTQSGEELGHRAGWDFTFNAPKTVSLTATVGADDRVRRAHGIAVRAALDAIENYVQARIGGDHAAETTGKWIAATFEHDTARPVDGYPAPHLHTHVIVFNMTEDRTGQARSLQPYELFRIQSMATATYQNKLESQLRKIGYGIERGTNHAPDIKGYSREYLESESLRAAQLRKEMEDRGLIGRDAMVNLAHQNREKKLKLTPEQLQQIHRQHAQEHGNQPDRVVAEAGQKTVKEIAPDKALARAEAAVTFARNRLAERTSVFDHFEVVRDALRHTQGRIGLPEIEAELDRQKAAGLFIEVQHIRPNAPAFRYTTPELVAIERETIRAVYEGQGKVQPIATLTEAAISDRFKDRLDSEHPGQLLPNLNADQIRLTQQALSNRDVIFGIQGRAGTGKTTALSAIRELAEANGYKACGLGPTSRAVKGLKEAGMEAETLQAHLLAKQQPENEGLFRPKLFFVDESSLASSKQMHDFLEGLGPRDRVLLIGDTKQHQSVEAGRIFEELQDAGLGVARLEKIVRQKDDDLRLVVEAMADGRIADGVELLKSQDRVQTIEHREQRFRAIAHAFAEAPQSTLVISPDNQSREELNARIRSALKEEGQVGEDIFKLGILKNRQNLTSQDRKEASSYRVGDSIRYHRGSDINGFAAKSYASVVDVNPDENLLTVRKPDGKFVTYDPARLSGVAVYEPEVRSFAIGDRVQFLTPWREKAISTRDTGTIQYLDPDGNARVRLDESDRVVSWNLNQNKHIDYAYAMTSHSSQGTTVDQVLVHIDTSETRIQALINEMLAYVALSRPRFNAQIYTDNADKLEKALSRSNQNTTALSQEQIRQPVGMSI